MLLNIRADGSVDRVGITTPSGTRVHARFKTTLGGLLPEATEVIAVAVPTHKYWTANYAPWATAPAEIIIYRLTNQAGAPAGCVRVAEVFSLPAKAATSLAGLRG